MDELTETIADKNEVVQMLLRLPRWQIAEFDGIARDLEATSRNHAMGIIISSIKRVRPARATVKLPKMAKVRS